MPDLTQGNARGVNYSLIASHRAKFTLIKDVENIYHAGHIVGNK